jgi:hypothetical protein
LAATERILNAALHLQQIAFAHACVFVLSLVEVGGKLAHHLNYRNKLHFYTKSKDISLNFQSVPPDNVCPCVSRGGGARPAEPFGVRMQRATFLPPGCVLIRARVSRDSLRFQWRLG